MIILGIETSCDETTAAVLTSNKGRVTILSNVVASSASLQAKYGGVIPEQAAREQIKAIIPVIGEALQQAKKKSGDLDAIAITYGPGLIGSLLVGVETAKVLATIWKKPLIPVNHLIGHFYANWIQIPDTKYQIPTFPCLGLLVSGGHTDLVLFQDHGKYTYLGGTRDDAAGECFDKCARLLGLPYPGGPEISKLARLAKRAQKGNPQVFDLPRPMINSSDLDFSFSGLKTAVANLVKEAKFEPAKAIGANDLAASIEQAIVDVLVAKTIKAAQIYKVNQIMIAGGVAANQKLTSEFKKTINHKQLTINLFIPPPNLCTDNAAMIAAAAFFQKQTSDPLKLQADSNLSL